MIGFIHKSLTLFDRVIGMDGCSVNTGIHNGAIRLIEVHLQDVLQHVICGLHMNELVFWHILCETDGVTKGPDSLSGPVGSTLSDDIWLDPVVNYQPVPGKVPELPEDVVEQLSRDQQLAYQYAHAVQSGEIWVFIFFAKLSPSQPANIQLSLMTCL